MAVRGAVTCAGALDLGLAQNTTMALHPTFHNYDGVARQARDQQLAPRQIDVKKRPS